jgi:hypothetical protein
VACVSFALVASCTVPATQILVTVDTDFYVPSEIDTVRVRVLYASDAEGEPEEARAFETPPPLDAPTDARVILGGRVHELRRTVDFALGPAGSTLPIELSLVPSAGDEGRVARIEAYGLRDGAVRAIASVRTRFARHRTSRIPLTLFVACDSIRCEAGETCGPGGAELSRRSAPLSRRGSPRPAGRSAAGRSAAGRSAAGRIHGRRLERSRCGLLWRWSLGSGDGGVRRHRGLLRDVHPHRARDDRHLRIADRHRTDRASQRELRRALGRAHEPDGRAEHGDDAGPRSGPRLGARSRRHTGRRRGHVG